MASVGGITCSFVKGGAGNPKQRVALWQVAGIDGYGAQWMGLGESDFRFQAVGYGSITTVRAWLVSMQNLQGRLVTIVDDWGTNYYRCLICRISEPSFSTAVGAGGCRGEILIEGVIT